MKELKISTSWIRGVVGEALTPELAVNFACAFGTWAEGGPVAICRDTRRSSPMLRAAVAAGLMSTGCEVIDIGVCSTPLLSFAVRELGCSGGIAITGSHNDARWNALKFLGPDGPLLNPAKGEELLDIYHASSFAAAALTRAPAPMVEPNFEPRYLEHLLSSLDLDPIRARGFRVALDFCNGVCAGIAAEFLTKLGCTLVPVNAEATGDFAHAPAPAPANMGELARRTLESKADLGAAFNIDGDRVAFVQEKGIPLSEEYTLPLAALSRLARRPGTVVTNLSTSRMIESLAHRCGQSVTRTAVGESYVMDRGLEEGAVLAGEGSGGVAALPVSMTFDALLTLGMVLETMATSSASLAELVGQLPVFAMRKGEIPCLPDQAYRTLEYFRLCHDGRSPDCTDGVRVEWADAWLHVRVSNTEPLVRVIVEAESEGRAGSLFAEAMELARRALAGSRGAHHA